MRKTLTAATALLVAACGSSPTSPPRPTAPAAAAEAPAYRATIRWTSHGVPHVVARDVGSLGYGQGYAMAEAHVCTIADVILRVRGERARWFGAGDGDVHVRTDLANRHLGFVAQAEAAWPTLSAEARAVLDGFAAGHNRWLADHPAATRPAACKDAPWVQPIRGVDVAAHGLATATLASSRFFEQAIATAAPGAKTGALPPRPSGMASNAWAIGADRTASGGGILIGNPHFPWDGDLRFHEVHLTIPGDLDVYGVSLLGIPGVLIGVTPHHAWSHTFSASTHLVMYRLALDGGSALRYRHGDDTLPIIPTTHTVDVRNPDGSIDQVKRTLYRSQVGPMIATEATPWDGPGGFAFTLRDVAAGGTLAIDQYLAMARARSRDEFERALALHGTPFVNTIYADAGGDALYVDGSRVPALTEQGLAGWKLARTVVPAVEAAWRRGVVVLDGSNPLFDLTSDDPRAPGAVPIAEAPRLLRRDHVMNANDSYRFTNLAAPEAAAERAPLWGDDDGRPSPRTLANLALLRPDDAAWGGDGKLTLDEAAAAMLSNRSFTYERLRDEVATACKDRKLAGPCAVLTAWDGRYATTSRGAALWRETMAELAGDGALPWARRFDRQAPTLTPDGVDAATPDALAAALRRAAATLGDAAGAPLGDLQQAARGGAGIAVPGGDHLDGVANVVAARAFRFTVTDREPRPDVRYPVDYGSSFILAAELTPAGPRARALLTYGNSGDPASPHYRDQLDAFARGELRPVLLTDAEIAADPAYRVQELASP